MIRTPLRTYDSVADCVDNINSLTAAFIKDNQRKPVSDLFVSTTYPANDEKVTLKIAGVVIHEIMLVVSDQVQKETDAKKLNNEIEWFKEKVKS